MTSGQILQLIAAAGAELKRRKMKQHVSELQLYYLAVRRGLDGEGHRVSVQWTEEKLVELARALRLPPFDGSLETQDAGVPCFKCKPGKGGRSRPVKEMEWGGGAVVRCQTCRRRWLVDAQSAVAR